MLARTYAAQQGMMIWQAAELARAWREEILEVPELAQALEPRGSDTGSNWWVLSGEKTTTGHPMLANDPHLALNTPATFYEAHLMTANQLGCGVSEPPPTLLRFAPADAQRLIQRQGVVKLAVREQRLPRLAEGQQSVGALAAPFDMSLAAASKHIRVLERAGLVRRSVRGRRPARLRRQEPPRPVAVDSVAPMLALVKVGAI